jgi:hypothetical protein
VSIDTLITFAALVVMGLAVVAFLIARWLLGMAGDMAKVARRQFARRAVDALFVVIGFKWLQGRTQPAPRPRPPVLQGDEIYRACPLSRWQGDAAACRWCNRMLPQRAGKWCTARCRIDAEQNHIYNLARDAALTRDGHRCTWPGCAVEATYERAIETNHIELARGRHDQPGCIHHLDNLESLCGPHHDEVTAGQRAQGWAS